MMIGFAAGFSPALLRAMELFGSLLAPLTLALGVVELVARTVQARFAARLIAASYVIVAVVIILLDPIIGTFGKSLPKVSGHYSSLPGLVLDGRARVRRRLAGLVRRGHRGARQPARPGGGRAHGAARDGRARRGADGRRDAQSPARRCSSPSSLAGAAALVWFGATRLLPDRAYEDDDEEPEYYEDMRRLSPADLPHDAALRPTGPTTDGRGSRRSRPRRPDARPPPMPGGPQGRAVRPDHDLHADRRARRRVRPARRRGHSRRTRPSPARVVYACHMVDNAPDQRLFYQLFRDANAVEAHTRQPHVQRFAREARAHVEGTNVIELTRRRRPRSPGPPEPGRPEPQQARVPAARSPSARGPRPVRGPTAARPSRPYAGRHG